MTIIQNAHVISPGIDREGQTIVAKDGKIVQVTSRKVAPKKSDTVYDAKGKYVMPGFIDVHTHGEIGRAHV